MNYQRTWMAIVLTFLAVALPCTAWFYLGMKNLEKEIASIELKENERLLKLATFQANRLQDELNRIKDNESYRPFYHYQKAFQDAHDEIQRPTSIHSPLNDSVSDPLIETYFQINPEGKITFFGPQEGLKPVEKSFPSLYQSNALTSQAIAQHQAVNVIGNITTLSSKSKELKDLFRGKTTKGKVEVLPSAIWEEDIKLGEFGGRHPSLFPENELYFYESILSKKLTKSSSEVWILTSPLVYTTFRIENDPKIIALRGVVTPRGLLTQGFVISSKVITDSLRSAEVPMQLVYKTLKNGELYSPLRTMPFWKVMVSSQDSLNRKESQARELRNRFLRNFGIGVIVTSFVGCCVIFLIWQIDRLSMQRSQFAAAAAHELKTPLSCLLLYSEMLVAGKGDAEKTKSYAQNIVREVERLGRVVANVMSYTGLERQSLKLNLQKSDLDLAITENLDRLEEHLKNLGINLKRRISVDLPQVPFDKDAVAIILQNLLDNAEKYSRTAENRTIEVVLEKVSESGVCLSVIDQGPGVPRSMRPSIFKPFKRGKSEKGLEGLGLGLSLAQSLAIQHHTKIEYRDNPGGGSIFSVVFN